jgi:hypothetical protein
MPKWPRISLARVKEIEERIRTRAKVLVPRTLKEQIPSPIFGSIARLAWSTIGEGKLLDFIHWTIVRALLERDQLQEYAGISKEARIVAMALSDTKFDYRDDKVLSALMEKGRTLDSAIKDLSSSLLPLRIWSGTIDNTPCHAWEDRRPGWFSRNVPGWSGAPVIG